MWKLMTRRLFFARSRSKMDGLIFEFASKNEFGGGSFYVREVIG